MRMNKGIKVVLCIIGGWLLLGIGFLIGINFRKEKYRPIMVLCTEKNWKIDGSELADLTEDNFWKFARASYILVGDYPNYDFCKIVSEVPRNDFNTENFYIDDATDKMYYHDDSGKRTSKLVIDVSSYQSQIDWDMIKAQGVDMAIIRVAFRGYGEAGKLVEDEMFKKHCEAALEAGLQVGVYVFSQALNTEEGAMEAKFALDIIKDYDIKGPVVIDTECVYADAPRTENLDINNRTDSIVAFCETVKKAGYRPMIYANRNWYAQSLDMTRLGEYDLWLAYYSNGFDFPYRISGWQYTGNGSIDGIKGDVDLNVWFE